MHEICDVTESIKSALSIAGATIDSIGSGGTTMTYQDVITPAEPTGGLPAVRSISPMDLKDVIAKGVDDFWAMPTHVVFLSLIYPIVGIAIGRATLGYDVVPLLYPLAAGFALIGPFAAIGLYELSRRRQLGLNTSWKHSFDVIHSPSFGSIVGLGLLLMAIFGIWVAIADAIYIANFGYREPTSVSTFVSNVLTTQEGHNLIIFGNLVGFLFAVLALSLSVVSFPLLLDRHVSVATAILTSVKVVLKNPVTMALWGLIVACALVIGSLPFFVGLAVVMPVLGHSTWHLYCKVIEPETGPRPEYRPRPKARRYAADFPAVLFPWAKVKAVESATTIHALCHTADEKMSVTFDATPWFREADAESIIKVAKQGWSSPWIADALQHRSGYERLRELMQYATQRLQQESLEDPTWSTFECIVTGPEAVAWLEAQRPDVAAKIRTAH
jgi:uncharacterized membrane protein